MTVVPDKTFGNRGTLWSGMAVLFESGFTDDQYVHTLGGFTTGVHVLPNGSACLVVGGWSYFPPPATPGVDDKVRRYTTVKLVVFPPDGSPQERLRWDGTRIHNVSESQRDGFALASCSTPTGDVAVLLRQDSVKPFSPNPSEYTMCIVSPAGQVQSRDVVSPQWLYDAVNGNPAGTVRIATDGTDLGIASSWGSRLAVVLLHGAGSTPRSFDLAGTPSLPGLVRVEVASVRFNGGAASIALTAHLNHPGVGATSVGAILRIRADGTRDVNFGENGIWASPLGVGYRDFICAGETAGGLAGCVGRRAVAFAIDPNGIDLDQSFAGSGVAEHDLGGPLADPVLASDASGMTIFAQRVPRQADRAGDLRTAGCRFQWAPGSPNHGAVDGSFGVAGTATVPCDEAPVTPAGIVVSGSQMFVGGTRQIHGADCDRVPVVVALSLPTAQPNVTYGDGGFALLGSVRHPALVGPDGSAVFVERTTATTVPALRFTTPTGAQGPLRSLAPISAGSLVSTLTRLADGSILVAGNGPDAWVVKMGPTGVPDPAFGTAGIALPNPVGGGGDARVLGSRSDGSIALYTNTANASQLTVMKANGQIDTTYGTAGFVDIKGFTHPGGTSDARCFLDTDDSVICVASSTHVPGDPFSSPVAVGLRRVTPTGAYDPNFGLGLPSVAAPASGTVRGLYNPDGTTGGLSDYSAFAPVGMARLGTRLYVVGTGWTGGGYIPSVNRYRPAYPLLVITAWNANGSVDATFATGGLQEAGYSPTILYWSASGVIPDSATSFFIFGNAGDPETITTSVGGQTNVQVRPRQPQPALYRVAHPGGLDLAFGGDGASTIRVQEFLLTSVAGAMVTGGRVRVACIDALQQPWTDEPRVNLGGLAQWRPGKTRPVPKPRPPRPRPRPRPPQPPPP